MRFCNILLLYLTTTTHSFIIPQKSKSIATFAAASKDPSLEFPTYDFPYEAKDLNRPPLPTSPNAKKAEKPKKMEDFPTPTRVPEPVDIPTNDIFSRVDTLKKDIISKSSSIDTTQALQTIQTIQTLQKEITFKPLTLNEVSTVAPYITYIAVPVVGLISLRVNKAQREKREKERKAKEEAERLAKEAKKKFDFEKSLKPIVESVAKTSSEAVEKATGFGNKVKEDVRKKLDLDDDTVTKSAVSIFLDWIVKCIYNTILTYEQCFLSYVIQGAVGVGIIATGLLSNIGKSPKTAFKEEPIVKKVDYKPPKAKEVEKTEPPKYEEKKEPPKYEEKKEPPKIETPIEKPTPNPKSQNQKKQHHKQHLKPMHQLYPHH